MEGMMGKLNYICPYSDLNNTLLFTNSMAIFLQKVAKIVLLCLKKFFHALPLTL